MMRLTSFILLSLATIAIHAHSVHGLAFVASMMRVPTVGPVATLKSLGRSRPRSTMTSTLDGAATTAVLDEIPPKQDTTSFDDESVRAMRNEMVDIVYQRSLERLNGFAPTK